MLPSEIWLAGKGPSLDRFDWSNASRYRIGINEAAFIIPDCYGAIACDQHILEKYKNLPPNVIVFRRDTHTLFNFPCMVLWNYKHLITRINTAPSAVNLFYSLGARTIHFVGFDSVDGILGYAQCVKDIDGVGTNQDGFNRINNIRPNNTEENGHKDIGLLDTIKILGVNAVWEHRKVRNEN